MYHIDMASVESIPYSVSAFLCTVCVPMKGADKNSQANDGATALYEASKNGCEETVKLLLGLRADANKETKSGILPIHIATRRGRPRWVVIEAFPSVMAVNHCTR